MMAQQQCWLKNLDMVARNKNHFVLKHYKIVVGTEDGSSAASARTLLLKLPKT